MNTLLRTFATAAALFVTACAPVAAPAYYGTSPAQTGYSNTSPQGQGVRINGVDLSAQRIVELGGRPEQIPAGDYWYDGTSGLWGIVGSGARGVIAAGLPLGAMPEGVSGRGMTGVFVNGREITLDEAAYLARLVGGQVAPGRYFLDGSGNAGQEGGPVVINLFQKARQATYMGSSGTNGSSGGYYDPSTGESYFSFRDSSGKSYETTY
jgi:hypothetical protein